MCFFFHIDKDIFNFFRIMLEKKILLRPWFIFASRKGFPRDHSQIIVLLFPPGVTTLHAHESNVYRGKTLNEAETVNNISKTRFNNIKVFPDAVCMTVPVPSPDSPWSYDSLPYQVFSDHSWLQLWQWHVCVHRTPQSSMDRDLLSAEQRKDWSKILVLFRILDYFGTLI